MIWRAAGSQGNVSNLGPSALEAGILQHLLNIQKALALNHD
ncbi:unnamed protein product, partial [Larinioides sclopetarius]